jgi:HSP20 family protein
MIAVTWRRGGGLRISSGGAILTDMTEYQRVPVKVYRSLDLLTVAAPMAGLGAEDITVEVTGDGRLVLDGRLCPVPKLDRGPPEGTRDVLVNEWMVGPYHRELALGTPVDGPAATITYGNGVLVVTLPVAETTRPARLSLEPIGPTRGEHAGNPDHPPHSRK